MTENFKIRVYINTSPTKFRRVPGGYAYGDPLEQALEFDLETEDVNMALDCTFHALNVDNSPGFGTLTSAAILRYHLQYPSLSVGDVVEVNGYKYACEPTGWKAIGVREVICEVCNERSWTGDHLEICADCRQTDYGADMEDHFDQMERDRMDDAAVENWIDEVINDILGRSNGEI